ncbi:MAG: VOC family protein [Pseudomonadota bacterium]
MITALDHCVLICPDIDVGIADYSTIFGRLPDWISYDRAVGTATAQFRTENCALELLAPCGQGPTGARILEMLAEGGPRLTSLAFETDDVSNAHHTLARRGLSPSDVTEAIASHAETGEARRWKRARLSDQACGGVKTFVLEFDQQPEVPPKTIGGVSRLDHLVINTPNPDRAAAQYGARLGLNLALDRTAPEWKTRFLFFRIGGLTLEIVHRLDLDQDLSGPDSAWGLTWAVDDLECAHERLTAAGRDLSEIRKGRKPGSHVFTLRDGTLNIPTLFIAHSPR